MKKRIHLKPSWLIEQPQTPLAELLYGKKYQHHILCSCGRSLPIGSPGCVCLKLKVSDV